MKVSWLRKVPGFRTRTPWKMVLAGAAYSVLSLFVLLLAIGLVVGSEQGEEEVGAGRVDAGQPAVRIKDDNRVPGGGPTEKTNQQAMKEWSAALERKMEDLSASWDTGWRATFAGMASRTLAPYEAYSRLSRLDNDLGEIERAFYSNKVPEGLGGENARLLTEAVSDLGTAVRFRRQAVQLAMQMLEGGEGVTLEKVQENVQKGDAFLVLGIGKWVQVEKNLGIK